MANEQAPVRKVQAARKSPNTYNEPRRVEARILYPALGFPAVIGPPQEANRINGTTSIHLLLLAHVPDLEPGDVAWHLRYAPLSEPLPRYLDPNPGPRNCTSEECANTTGSFPRSDIEVRQVTPGASNDLVRQVTFARGFIQANLSAYVLDFYNNANLPYLYDVAICEKAAGRVPAGNYTLLWNNRHCASTRKDPSDEMRVLADYFQRERFALAHREKKLPSPPRDDYFFEHEKPHTAEYWVELLHPLFVRDSEPEGVNIAHFTDTHVCVRAGTFAERIQQFPIRDRDIVGKYYNNYNKRFEEVYPLAQACDVVLLTGDIVDYGRGYGGTGPLDDLESYPLDRNWFLFYSLFAGRSSKEDRPDDKSKGSKSKGSKSKGSKYTTPVYTVLGNHDWRQDPYGPMSSFYTIDQDLQLNEKELADAHGPGATAKIYRSSTNTTLAERKAEAWPLLTSLDSVKWYLLLVNPFLDYVARHPGGCCFLMLDWAKEEKVISIEELKGILPVAKASLSELQKGLVQWFLQRPESAKCVGLHAGIVSPGPTDDVLRRGTLVPCPLCGGTRINPHARIVTDGGIQHGPRDCDCTRMMSQPASDSEPSRRPYLAMNAMPQAETKVPDSCMPVRGTIMWHRDWFIRELMHHRVAAVFSGHAHRNVLMWIRQKPTDDFLEAAIPAGTAMLVDQLPLSGDASPPVFVNTSSAGPVGWRRPNGKVWIPELPGITVVRLRFDGALLSARYACTSGLPLRARSKGRFTDDPYTLPSGYPDWNRPLAPSKT